MHTQGPWTAWFNDPDEYGYILEAGIDTADRKVGVADIHCDNIDKNDPAEWNAIVKADAALIAAAPELLAAAKTLMERREDGMVTSEEWDNLSAAISKATSR